MEHLGVVYLYNKEQGMLVGKPSFTFRSQRTVFDSKRFASFAGDVVLPFLQLNKNIIPLGKDLLGYCCCYLLSHAKNCLF